MIWQNKTSVIGSLYNQALVNPGNLAEHSVGSVTLPPGALAPGRAIKVTGIVQTESPGTCTARLEIRLNGFGGTNIVNPATASAGGGISGIDGMVIGVGATSQVIMPTTAGKNSYIVADSAGGGTETLDYTQAIDVEFIITLGVDATGTATLHYGCVEQLS